MTKKRYHDRYPRLLQAATALSMTIDLQLEQLDTAQEVATLNCLMLSADNPCYWNSQNSILLYL